ncbi:PIG-L family deacetylase [Brevibacillus laterosporus]|uniref:PIG-L deacetylase family protein n=1 Tax=Brevibacillus laterosporus TaxID=1465 RepID=UPI003D243417
MRKVSENAQVRRLLFLFPHPDDESFACAGTMAKYSELGQQIYLVTATSGDKGKCGPYSITCQKQLAVLREHELSSALSVLGVAELLLYRFPDGGLAQMDQSMLTERVLQTLLSINPQIIITFPPDGVTGHPDHIALSHAVETAVKRYEEQMAQQEYPDLYYVSIPHYYDYCMERPPQATFPITAKVDISKYRHHKGKALQVYKSQEYSVNKAFPGVLQGDFTVINPYEYYTLVRSRGRNEFQDEHGRKLQAANIPTFCFLEGLE